MNEIRVTTQGLPNYKYPLSGGGGSLSHNLVQGRLEGKWLPLWLLVDGEGTPLAILEADSFDGLDAGAVSQKAAEFVMEMHGLGEEDTGNKVETRQAKHEDESYTYWIY